MLDKKLECAEVMELCRQCAKAKEERGKPCYWVTQENYFCKNCIIADNSLAWFKKIVVDENTRKPPKKNKLQFAESMIKKGVWTVSPDFLKLVKENIEE